MSKSCRALSTCLVLMGSILSHEAHAALLTVTSLADAGPGTFRDQVAAAAPGDTINFSVTGTIPLTTGVIAINKNLTIAGPGSGSLTVAGDTHSSILTIGGGTVDISGLTLTNGGGTSALVDSENTYVGGAIYMSAGTATIADCTVTANDRAIYGGGIYLGSGSLTIERGTISNNGVGYIGHGGGIYVEGGSLAVTDSTISGNIAGYGAGLFSEGGETTVTLTNTTLSGNIAKNDGGHLYHVFSIQLQKFYDLFLYYDGSGGGIYNFGATVNIVNSTLSGNGAESHEETSGTLGGGGIWNSPTGTLNIANTTITGNYSEIGGGIRNSGALFMSNTLVAGNTSSGDDIWGLRFNGGDTVVAGDYNLVQSSEFTTFTGTHNIEGQDAKLGPLLNNGGPTKTHRLLARSPALDAGDPAFVATNMPYDQRGPGFPRIYNGRVCIGSFESEANQSGPSVIVNSLDDHDDGVGGVTDCTLREAVNYASPGATITFSVAGTITLTGGEMLIGKNLTIIGPTGAFGITVSGNNASRIFRVTPGTAAVTNTVNFASLTLSGGTGASSIMPGVGGAIYTDTFTALAVTNCTLSGNHGDTGGAIRNGATMTVTGSTFSGNIANINAGAIQNGPNVLTLTNSTFSGNSTTGNTANGNGIGGALRTAGSPTVTSCTFSGNSATLRGGAIEIAGGATASFSNTVVAGNSAPTGPDINGTTTAGDYNLVQNIAGATLVGTHNLTGQVAKLNVLANYGGRTQTLALLKDSPAVNAGGNALVPGGVTTDQRGSTRMQGSAVDIGAFEVDPTPLSVTINQASSQTDPTISTPVHFTAVFNKLVTGFTTGDVTLDGSALSTTATVTGTGTTYDVTVTGMTRTGTVLASIAAGVALDPSTYDNIASTSTDNSISYSDPETVRRSGRIHPTEGGAGGGGYNVGFIGNPGQEYNIQFSTDLAPGSWQTLTTQVADLSGVISIIDNPPAGTAKRFYRVLLP